MKNKGQSIADTLAVFGDKSQDADNLKVTILDIVRKISEAKESEGGKDWDFGSFLASPLSPHEGNVEDVEVEGIDSLKNLILAPKSYKDGGEVNIYNKLLEQVAGKAGMETSGVENLMSKIAYRESKGVPTQKQISDGMEAGPGRGLYQYELGSLGGSGAGRTAMNRLSSVLGEKNLPEWASSYFGKEGSKRDVDFSEMTEEQQNILFLADKLQDPMEGNISAMKDMGAGEWWKKFHHKGKASKEEEEKLIKGFMEDISYAERNKGAKWNQ